MSETIDSRLLVLLVILLGANPGESEIPREPTDLAFYSSEDSAILLRNIGVLYFANLIENPRYDPFHGCDA